MEKILIKAEPDRDGYGDHETVDRNSTMETTFGLVSSQPFFKCDILDQPITAVKLEPEDHVHSIEQAPHSNCQNPDPSESVINRPVPIAVFRNQSADETALVLRLNYVNPESEQGMKSPMPVMEWKLQYVKKRTGKILEGISSNSITDSYNFLSFSHDGKGKTDCVDKPYKCSLCSFRTSKSGYLKDHVRTHSTERPYKCSFCSYSATRHSRLKEHEQTHSTEKLYKCSFCPYSTCRKGNLEVHERTHTGERPYKCCFCSFSAAYKSVLKTHQRTHTGEKPYKCSFCSYSSACKGDVARHDRTHTGEKPFRCSLCPYGAARKEALKKHEKTHISGKKSSEKRLLATQICPESESILGSST